MTNKSDWQEANRRLMAEQRKNLGEPPTAEELQAYSRGELSESEEERIRDLLVAYPELSRMYAAPFAEEAQAGISDDEIAAGLKDVQRRIGTTAVPLRRPVRHYLPTTIAAALALLFFGLYVQADGRNRPLPRILGAPQEIYPDAVRGEGAATPLSKDDGEAYLLRAHVINEMRYRDYEIELHDAKSMVWSRHTSELSSDGAFSIVIPHDFLRAGVTYQLRIFGVDGNTRRHIGTYDVAASE